MNELIKITNKDLNGADVNTVNARELHEFLEVGKDFSTWVKVQIERARLVENRDFVIIPQKGEYKKPLIEYHLTIESAKHVAMMSGTDKGFAVRDYFIECEKIAKQKPVVDPMTILNDPSTMRTLLLSYTEKVIALEEEKKIIEPKAAALDRIATANGSLNITETAKSLQAKPKALFQWLSANKWIYRRPGGKNWLAYQPRIQHGVLEHKATTVTMEDGTEKILEHVLVTPKGLSRLAEIFIIKDAA